MEKIGHFYFGLTALHENAFRRRRDALFETLDALLLASPVTSFAMLSLDPRLKRQWHSLYKALEKGELNEVWLSTYLARQVPCTGVQFFALDGTAWPRPRPRTLDDRQYIYHPTQAVNGGSVCVGYPYSLLDWVPTPHSSWSLSVNLQRIPSTNTASEIGARQVKALGDAHRSVTEGLDIVAADAKYGNARFLRSLQGQSCGIVVRLRKDRVLRRALGPPSTKRCGRPRVHGARFAFKESDTWAHPLRSWRSNIRTGDKSSWNAGIVYTASAMLMSRLISFVPALILSAPSLPSLFGWPGKPHRTFPCIWRSPLKSSGKPTVIAGPSSLASVFANSALGGTCRVSSKKSPVIAGVGWWRWLSGSCTWLVPLFKIILCLGKSHKPT